MFSLFINLFSLNNLDSTREEDQIPMETDCPAGRIESPSSPHGKLPYPLSLLHGVNVASSLILLSLGALLSKMPD